MGVFYGGASALTVQLEGPFGSVGSSGKITQVLLMAANWKNGESPFFQTVEVAGVSESSLINIQATGEQVAKLSSDGIALQLENDAGIVTAWAIGSKPAEDLTLQITLTEVVSA